MHWTLTIDLILIFYMAIQSTLMENSACRYPISCTDEQRGSCNACIRGCIGPKCTVTCRYPSYGVRCQSKCECVEEQCDPIKGCGSIQILYHKSTWTGLNSANKFMLISTCIIGTVFLVVLGIYMYIICYVKQTVRGQNNKWKWRRINARTITSTFY
ncbi:uncharacterized protein LOC128185821 [Crassostrea angulata]|uniref:uncharacterized protein LOC128185821 n=1 Tax=Magallana angulata TaxID=2784310 RepID=UPI0022B20EC1|nr:uncharacterized protein LOC128185821 [Crassostrea angulata]